jgi:CubicO group peptidase (beta-lactamase class C family)
MNSLRRSLWLLLVVVLMAAPVAPVLAQDGGDITLVPFTSEMFGIQGVMPDGWSEAAPGVYARGASMGDLTSLIMQAAPVTPEELGQVLVGQLGIDALPDPADTLETAAYTWDLYVIDVDLSGTVIKVDLALTTTEAGAALVLLQTGEADYDALHEAVFLPAVDALAPLSEDADAEDASFSDPDGRFTVPLPTNWTAEARDGYAFLAAPEEVMTVKIIVIEDGDIEAARDAALDILEPDFDRELNEAYEDLPTGEMDDFVLYDYGLDDNQFVQIEVRLVDEVSYVLIFAGDFTAAQQRAAQLQIIDSGFDITALEATSLIDVEPLPLTDAIIAEFEAYIEDVMARYQTPGAAVAIVRDGEVIYASGFGDRNPEGDPVTPETRMMIGSTTKTMTTLLMAQLVDEDLLAWDEPVVDVLPSFAVADPAITQQVEMEHLVCACTGVPRRDLEIVFNSADLSAEAMIESLETFEFFTGFGEAFQYSNQMVAAAGYIAALAAGGEYGDLYNAYVNEMETRIFAPLAMDSTTFSYDEVTSSDNYAIPHSLTLAFTYEPIGFDIEDAFLTPITPAGAAWSTVLDMANYMIMQLNEGVAPDGTRIVSAENLAHTWQPQIDITAQDSYGLGWIISDYYDLPLYSHSGNTIGFTSEFAFLPEADLGIAVLTNQQGSLVNAAARARLFELLYELPPQTEEALEFQYNMAQENTLEVYNDLQMAADPDVAAMVAGTYTNDALGPITLAVDADGALVMDADDFRTVLAQYVSENDDTEDDTTPFVMFDPPLAGFGVGIDITDDGVTVTIGGGVAEYEFTPVE